MVGQSRVPPKKEIWWQLNVVINLLVKGRCAKAQRWSRVLYVCGRFRSVLGGPGGGDGEAVKHREDRKYCDESFGGISSVELLAQRIANANYITAKLAVCDIATDDAVPNKYHCRFSLMNVPRLTFGCIFISRSWHVIINSGFIGTIYGTVMTLTDLHCPIVGECQHVWANEWRRDLPAAVLQFRRKKHAMSVKFHSPMSLSFGSFW